MSASIWQDGKWLRAIFAAAVALTIVFGHTVRPALAEDDEDKWDTIDNKILRGILNGLGLKRDGEAGIDYHERSPLVVPPTRDLPPPETTATITTDPAWPKDPDLAQRKQARKRQKATAQSEEDDMRQLTPSQLRGATGQQVRRGVADEAPGVQGAMPEQLSPSDLGHSGFSFGSMFGRGGKVVQFTGEPPRTSLTDPPVGLRTPSSRYPYGSKGVLEAEKNGPRDQASYGTDK